MSRPPAHIFGPVPSRRLGRSLGIDVIPPKICTLDCLYCEAGPTSRRCTDRGEYIPTAELLGEMRSVIPLAHDLDSITFTGTGEPTLHVSLGRLIEEAKNLSDARVAVLTNGTLIDLTDVQDDLMAADAVLPSLDAARTLAFRRLNRPASGITPERMVQGLVSFRRRYRGQIWLEVLLVRGFNDSAADLEALREAVDRIAPDKIHLNTVARPPAYPAARPVPPERMAEIAAFLGPRCEIVAPAPEHSVTAASAGPATPDAVAAIVARRPMTAAELAAALRVETRVIEEMMAHLVDDRRVRAVRHGAKIYYEGLRTEE